MDLYGERAKNNRPERRPSITSGVCYDLRYHTLKVLKSRPVLIVLCILVIIECICVMSELVIDIQRIRMRFENEDRELKKFTAYLKQEGNGQFKGQVDVSLEHLLEGLRTTEISLCPKDSRCRCSHVKNSSASVNIAYQNQSTKAYRPRRSVILDKLLSASKSMQITSPVLHINLLEGKKREAAYTKNKTEQILFCKHLMYQTRITQGQKVNKDSTNCRKKCNQPYKNTATVEHNFENKIVILTTFKHLYDTCVNLNKSRKRINSNYVPMSFGHSTLFTENNRASPICGIFPDSKYKFITSIRDGKMCQSGGTSFMEQCRILLDTTRMQNQTNVPVEKQRAEFQKPTYHFKPKLKLSLDQTTVDKLNNFRKSFNARSAKTSSLKLHSEYVSESVRSYRVDPMDDYSKSTENTSNNNNNQLRGLLFHKFFPPTRSRFKRHANMIPFQNESEPINASSKLFVIQIYNDERNFYMLGYIYPEMQQTSRKEKRKHKSEYYRLEKATHALHKASIIILGIFVTEALIKLTCRGKYFFTKKMEMFDAFIVITSFILDFVLKDPKFTATVKDAALVLVLLLPWRVIRIVNSFLMTMDHKHKIEKKTLQQARKKAENKVLKLQNLIREIERDVELLSGLCKSRGIAEDDISSCIYGKGRMGTTRTAISSFASLMLISTLGKDGLPEKGIYHDQLEEALSDPMEEKAKSSKRWSWKQRASQIRDSIRSRSHASVKKTQSTVSNGHAPNYSRRKERRGEDRPDVDITYPYSSSDIHHFVDSTSINNNRNFKDYLDSNTEITNL